MLARSRGGLAVAPTSRCRAIPRRGWCPSPGFPPGEAAADSAVALNLSVGVVTLAALLPDLDHALGTIGRAAGAPGRRSGARSAALGGGTIRGARSAGCSRRWDQRWLRGAEAALQAFDDPSKHGQLRREAGERAPEVGQLSLQGARDGRRAAGPTSALRPAAPVYVIPRRRDAPPQLPSLIPTGSVRDPFDERQWDRGRSRRPPAYRLPSGGDAVWAASTQMQHTRI